MSADGEAGAPAPQSKKNKFRKEKPWDHDGIDHWCVRRSTLP